MNVKEKICNNHGNVGDIRMIMKNAISIIVIVIMTVITVTITTHWQNNDNCNDTDNYNYNITYDITEYQLDELLTAR